MKLVAIARATEHPEVAARLLAEASGLTLAEARMRLAPEPPALLARLDPAAASALVATLLEADVAALEVPVEVPSDKDRTLAWSFAIADAGLTLTPRFGAPVEIGWPDVLAILRGVRASRSELQGTERGRRLSLVTAIATGGLGVTRRTVKTVRSSEESTEQVVLLFARDGRAAIFTERDIDFSCLGSGMQASSTANMAELARRLREGAPRAYYDERLLRLGRRPLPFLTGGESRTHTANTTLTRTDTSGSLDVLAEVIRLAVVSGLLPAPAGRGGGSSDP